MCIYADVMCVDIYIYIYIYIHTHICIGRTLVYVKLYKLLKARGKGWNLPKLAIPLFKVVSLHSSNIHRSNTQFGR